MSAPNTFAQVVTPASDASVAQGAASAVADVVGKGGFGAEATLGQLVEFQLTGLLVVFVVLGSLTLLCYLMAWILKTIAPGQYYGKSSQTALAPAKTPVKPALTSARQAADGIHPGLSDEELVVILVAAASQAMGQPAGLVKFRAMDSMDWTWSVQGRVGLHNLHTL